jgi:Tol biopolymer transport system component
MLTNGRCWGARRAMRGLWSALVTTTVIVGSVGVDMPAQAKVLGPNGRIAFARQATPAIEDQGHVVYTVDPDGTHIQELAEPADIPRWSPDGTEIAIGDAGCMFEGACSAVIFNADSGSSRVLPNPRPDLFVFCNVWAPDGAKLACGGLGDAPGVSGVYTIRSSDGGGLTQVLSCDECGPTDYSPDGKRLLLGLGGQLFSVKLNGSGLRPITPAGTPVDTEGGPSWSPRGDQILFGANADPDHRRSIFIVNADGTGLHQVAIPGCGGALSDPTSISCFHPGWSPDGTKVVFVRASAMFNVQNIYTANADGSGLFQVTHNSSGLEAVYPDWGTHPLAVG